MPSGVKLSEANLLVDVLQAAADMRDAQRRFFALKPGDPARRTVLQQSLVHEARVDKLLPVAQATATRMLKESLGEGES
jgi:hypothetical protein